MTADVAVVGGGLSGLVAALELAEKGKEVVLYESSDRLGGRLSGSVIVSDFYTELRSLVERLGVQWPSSCLDLEPWPHVSLCRWTWGDFRMLWELLFVTPATAAPWFSRHAMSVSEAGRVHLARFALFGLDYRKVTHTTVWTYYRLRWRHGWHLRLLELSDVTDALRRRLDELGVRIVTGTPVTSLFPQSLGARSVISALPLNAYSQMDNTGLFFSKHTFLKALASQTQHLQIGFRIRTTSPVTTGPRGLDLHSTPWGILLLRSDDGASCQGICTAPHHRDVNGTRAIDARHQDFQASVKEQIRDAVLTRWGLCVDQVDITDRTVLVTPCQTVFEVFPRPMAGTKIGSSVYLAGEGGKTSCPLNLLESAVLSGKEAALGVLRETGAAEGQDDTEVSSSSSSSSWITWCVVAIVSVLVGRALRFHAGALFE